MPINKKDLAIYIHWPFCKSKCPYCDFNSHVREGIDVLAWKKAYDMEIEKHSELISASKITSIFFGGGTPSLMPSSIVSTIIQKLKQLGAFDLNIEITLEANPTSTESKKFQEFSEAGINRVSLGIQSLNPNDLKFLGREHSADEALKAIEIAKTHFKRSSFDLIYALPKQTLKAWESELNFALTFAQDHLSLYQLTIEKGTAFYNLYQNKKFSIPNDKLSRDFYLLTQDIMNKRGLPAYEVSNHAASGEESRHNMTYWKYKDFLGIGPGAHSRIKDHAIYSVYNPENWLKNAINNHNTEQSNLPLSNEDKSFEMLMMGLRIAKGIDQNDYLNKIGKNFEQSLNKTKLDYLIKNDFLKFTNNHLFATKKGVLLLNSIINQLKS